MIFRKELIVSTAIVAVTCALVCSYSIVLDKILSPVWTDVNIPMSVWIAISAHIWCPILLLVVLLAIARIKFSRPKTSWLIDALVPICLVILIGEAFLLNNALKMGITEMNRRIKEYPPRTAVEKNRPADSARQKGAPQ